MSYLDQAATATLVNVKLTSKGREYLARGFKTDNVFDIVKFSFGDSEVDYTATDPTSGMVLEPASEATDIKSKIYATGSVPSGTPVVSLTNTNVSMTTYQTGINIGVTTQWPPVEGEYIESYQWTNLGPLNDYDFNMIKSVDTKTMTLTTQDVVGTTRIKVQGMTSGQYAILTLTIG